MSPLRTGITYGSIAVVVAVVSELRFLLIDPQELTGWLVAVLETFRAQLAFAAYILLAILAAIRTRPVRLDEGVPYRSLLLRDCALAAAIVGVMVAGALLVLTLVQATVLSGAVNHYASGAAVDIVDYTRELARRFGNPPPPVSVANIEQALQAPQLSYLGRSLFNGVLRAMLLGFLGAVVGALRGRFGRAPQDAGK